MADNELIPEENVDLNIQQQDNDSINLLVQDAQIISAPVDPTLTVSGMAADAKATGDAISAVNNEVGDLTDLDTTVKTDVVSAINEVHGDAETNSSNIGDLTNLDTTVKTDLVSAVNEVHGDAETNSSNIGDLTDLDTTVKTDVVSAVNEVHGDAETNATNIGTLSNLDTTAKADLVSAVNEVHGDASTNATSIGTLANLDTTAKSNLVSAVNEVHGDASTNATSIGTLANLNTTAKADLVSAVNEVHGDTSTNAASIGTLTNLNTTAKTDLVSAVNEVNSSVSTAKDSANGTNAIVINGTSYSQALASGTYIIWNGNPYITTTAIAANVTLESGVNVSNSGLGNGIANSLNSNIANKPDVGANNVKIRYGVATITAGGDRKQFDYGITFTNVPTVILTPVNNGNGAVLVVDFDIQKNYCVALVRQGTITYAQDVHWIAIGV